MREIQIVQWCDMCESVDDEQQLPLDRSPATQAFVISIRAEDESAHAARLIDVCDAHAKQFAELSKLLLGMPLATAVKSKATPPPEQKYRRVPCPVCQADVERSSLVAHIWAKHAHTTRPELLVGKCPDCAEVIDTATGLAAHRRVVHEYNAVVDALSNVKGYKITARDRAL